MLFQIVMKLGLTVSSRCRRFRIMLFQVAMKYIGEDVLANIEIAYLIKKKKIIKLFDDDILKKLKNKVVKMYDKYIK